MQKIIFSSLLLSSLNSFAEQATQALPNMVVTATRTETAKNQLSAAMTVYTRKDIDRLQAKTLPELLSGSTGIDIVQSGGYGKDTNIYMRGTNSDHVLVLVDGIKFGSVTSGTSPFQFIPLDQVERVEIIRGPQSSLYGSEAIGGVIQIFTRKGSQEDKPTVTLDAGGGSYDSYRVAGTVSGKWQNSWYSLGSSQFGSQGFDARQPTPGRFGVNQPDKDGYLNTAVNARLGHRFDNNAEVEAFFMHAEGKTEYDGSFQDKTEFVNQVVGITGSMDMLDNWRSILRFGQSRDNADSFAPGGVFSSQFDSTRWNASWLNEVALSDAHQLVIGTDYRLDEVDSTEAYRETSRYDAGIFAELHSRFFDDHFINASLRGDKNEAFGEQVTGNFGWRYNAGYGISPFASFGNAFKAPTFNQLYYPGFGNPNLKAEQSTSFEAGVSGDHEILQWELRAYHTNIDNLIIAVTNPTTFLSSAENVGKAQIDGLEAEIGTQIMGWTNKLNMSLLSPKNRVTNARLARRAEQSLSYDLSRTFGQFDVGAKVLAQGDRFDDTLNKTKVGGYVTVDLRSAYHLNKNWMLSANLNNLLDKNYQTVNTYNSADRNFFLSIHYNN
ncbi:MAG: TonB-dependent receptor [Methylobacter sp.]|nr:TonB-dependent receptor [Methylobacter sp.]